MVRGLRPPFPQSPSFLLSTCYRNIPSEGCSVWGSCSLPTLLEKQDMQQPGDVCTVPLVPKAEEVVVSSLMLWTAFLAEATSCSFVQRPQKPGGKQKYISKDRNVASLEGIPCLIPATAHSDPGSVEGQPSGVPQLCSASWALSA